MATRLPAPATAPKPGTAREPMRIVRAWRFAWGLLKSRAEVARMHAENLQAAQKIAADGAAIAGDLQAVKVLNSSLEEAVRERDREIERLKTEKAQLEATLSIRKIEIEELAALNERMRTEIQADIAVNIAREQRVLHPTARANAAPQGE